MGAKYAGLKFERAVVVVLLIIASGIIAAGPTVLASVMGALLR